VLFSLFPPLKGFSLTLNFIEKCLQVNCHSPLLDNMRYTGTGTSPDPKLHVHFTVPACFELFLFSRDNYQSLKRGTLWLCDRVGLDWICRDCGHVAKRRIHLVGTELQPSYAFFFVVSNKTIQMRCNI
jgi:hypothetical protein